MGRKKFVKAVIVGLCMTMLILDTKTALQGAKEGLRLCITCIIPSLFPFCVLSRLMCSMLLGKKLPFGHLLGMPKGTESIFLLSLIGGYPIGAQCIDDAYKSGAISKNDAQRLLGFCNNAGPAFLFGIMSCLFPNQRALWCLYIIHIISAVFVGMLLPNKSRNSCALNPKSGLTLMRSVEESTKSMVAVCSWIILFKIILAFILHWFGWFLDPISYAAVAGFLELSNGCIALQNVQNHGVRFILASAFLALGGGCVALQTVSVTKNCGIGAYYTGKLLQCFISLMLAAVVQMFVFSKNDIFGAPQYILLVGCSCTLSLLIFLYKTKNVWNLRKKSCRI